MKENADKGVNRTTKEQGFIQKATMDSIEEMFSSEKDTLSSGVLELLMNIMKNSGREWSFAEAKELLIKIKAAQEKPYLLVDFPSEKHLEFVKQPHPFKAFLGGNRSGKTETVAIEVLWHLLGEHPFIETPKPPVRWRIHVPEYQHVVKVIEEKFKKYLPPTALYGGSWETAFNKRMYVLRFANGSTVDFTTHRKSDRGLEGASLHGVWIDEECSFNHYRALVYRLIDQRGRLIVSATPIHGISWIYDEIVKPFEEGNPNYYVQYVSTYDNKYLSPEAISIIEEKATEEEKDIRLYGKIKNVSRRVFSGFDYHQHVEDFPFPPVGSLFVVGLDWGFFHKSALVFIAKYDDYYLVVDEYTISKVPLYRLGEEMENWASYHGVHKRNIRVVYDAALNKPLPNGTREVDLLKPYAFRMIPSHKNMALGVSTINQAFLDGRIVIHPRCKSLIEALQRFYFNPNGKVNENDPHKDVVDAFRYGMYYAITQNTYEPEDEEEPIDYISSAQEKLRNIILSRRSSTGRQSIY